MSATVSESRRHFHDATVGVGVGRMPVPLWLRRKQSLPRTISEAGRVTGEGQGLVHQELGRTQRQSSPLFWWRNLDLLSYRRWQVGPALLQLLAQSVRNHAQVRQGRKTRRLQLFWVLTDLVEFYPVICFWNVAARPWLQKQ